MEYPHAMTTVHVEAAGGAFAQNIVVRHHRVVCDEGAEVGGADSGPNPTELLLGALGACVAMTLKMYAGRKGWETGSIQVDLTGRDEHGVFIVERRLTFGAPAHRRAARPSHRDCRQVPGIAPHHRRRGDSPDGLTQMPRAGLTALPR